MYTVYRISKTEPVRSESGMSLIEVMIVVGIMAVIALAMASLITTIDKQITYTKLRADVTQVQLGIEDALRSSSSCSGNLLNPANNIQMTSRLSLTKVDYYDSTGTLLYTVVPGLSPTALNDTQAKVSSMTIVPPSPGPITPIAVVGPNKFYKVNLLVQYTLPAGFSSLAPRRTRAMTIKTDLSGNIVSCALDSPVTCVTGYNNASNGTTGTTDPVYSSMFNTIFTVISTGSRFGLQCNSPDWNMTGCTSSGLLSSGITTTSLQYTSSGCSAPRSSINPSGSSTIYLTCCSTY